MDNSRPIYDYEHGSAADLNHQEREIIKAAQTCLELAEEPDSLPNPEPRDVITQLLQEHARPLAGHAHSMALSIGELDNDSPIRRHMQDTAQYTLAVAGTIVKGAYAIYNAHAVRPRYAMTKPGRPTHARRTRINSQAFSGAKHG